MIQDIDGIQPELQRFRFRYPERLAQICIEPVCARHFECHLTEIALGSRFRVLQHDHAIARRAVGIGSKLLRACRSGWNDLCYRGELAAQA